MIKGKHLSQEYVKKISCLKCGRMITSKELGIDISKSAGFICSNCKGKVRNFGQVKFRINNNKL